MAPKSPKPNPTLNRILARNPEQVYAIEYKDTVVGDYVDQFLGKVCRLVGLDKVGNWLNQKAFPDQSKPNPKLKTSAGLKSTGNTLNKRSQFYTTHKPTASEETIITQIK